MRARLNSELIMAKLNKNALITASFNRASPSGIWPLVLLLVAGGGNRVLAASQQTQQKTPQDATSPEVIMDDDSFVVIRRCGDIAEDSALSLQDFAKLCGVHAAEILKEPEPDADDSGNDIIWKSAPLYEDGRLDADIPAHEKVCNLSDQKLLVWMFIGPDGKVIRFADGLSQNIQVATNEQEPYDRDVAQSNSAKITEDEAIIVSDNNKATNVSDANESTNVSDGFRLGIINICLRRCLGLTDALIVWGIMWSIISGKGLFSATTTA